MTKLLDDLQSQVELEGHAPGTPAYDRKLRKLKVEQCKQMQGAGNCSDCAKFEFCDLRKEHWFDRKYGDGDDATGS